MAGERPILMTQENADKLASLLGARIRSSGGIATRRAPNGDITITDQRRRSGGGGGRGVTEQRVIVKNVGGEAGGRDTQCTFEYNGWVLGTVDPGPTNQLFRRLQPIDGRLPAGQCVVVPDFSFAMAIWESPAEGEPKEWLLWYVPGEVLDTSPCNPCEP